MKYISNNSGPSYEVAQAYEDGLHSKYSDPNPYIDARAAAWGRGYYDRWMCGKKPGYRLLTSRYLPYIVMAAALFAAFYSFIYSLVDAYRVG